MTDALTREIKDQEPHFPSTNPGVYSAEIANIVVDPELNL